MSEDDLKNLAELNSKNKPRILTMYFEDGGEADVVPYDDYDDLQQRIDKAIEYIKDYIPDVGFGTGITRNDLLKILQGNYEKDN